MRPVLPGDGSGDDGFKLIWCYTIDALASSMVEEKRDSGNFGRDFDGGGFRLNPLLPNIPVKVLPATTTKDETIYRQDLHVRLWILSLWFVGAEHWLPVARKSRGFSWN